jgi:hypothetical protein
MGLEPDERTRLRSIFERITFITASGSLGFEGFEGLTATNTETAPFGAVLAAFTFPRQEVGRRLEYTLSWRPRHRWDQYIESISSADNRFFQFGH